MAWYDWNRICWNKLEVADTGIVCIREELATRKIPLEAIVPDPNIRHLIENAETILPKGCSRTLKFPVRFLRAFMHHAVVGSQIPELPRIAAQNSPTYLRTTEIGKFLLAHAMGVETLALHYVRRLNRMVNNLFETRVTASGPGTLRFTMTPRAAYLNEPGAQLGNLLHTGTLEALPALAGAPVGRVVARGFETNVNGEDLCTDFELTFQETGLWQRLSRAGNLLKTYRKKRGFQRLVKRSAFSPLELHLLEKLDKSQEILRHLRHDVTNDLAAVYSNLDMIRTFSSQTADPEMNRMVQDAFMGAQRMGNAIDAYVEMGRTHLRLQGMNIPVPRRDTAQILSPLQRDPKYGMVSFELIPGCRVKMADSRFKQVIVNLLNNAVRAAGHSDCPRVRVKDRLDHRRGLYLMTISDNGNGIPLSRQESIWHTYVSYSEGGSGIGLDVVRSAVKESGGRAWLKSSEPGKGSVFEISIPLFEPAVGNPMPAQDTQNLYGPDAKTGG